MPNLSPNSYSCLLPGACQHRHPDRALLCNTSQTQTGPWPQQHCLCSIRNQKMRIPLARGVQSDVAWPQEEAGPDPEPSHPQRWKLPTSLPILDLPSLKPLCRPRESAEVQHSLPHTSPCADTKQGRRLWVLCHRTQRWEARQGGTPREAQHLRGNEP